MAISLQSGDQRRGGPRPWLAQVVRNRLVRFRRSEDRRRVRERAAAKPEVSPSALDCVATFELHRHLVEAVDGLASPYRETVVLRFWSDLPPREIAQRTAVPVETVKTRLVRGLAMLRKVLDAKCGSRAAWAVPCGTWLGPSVTAGVAVWPKAVAIVMLALMSVSAAWLMTADESRLRRNDSLAAAGGVRSVDSGSDQPESPDGFARQTVESREPTGDLTIRVVGTSGTPIAGASVFSFGRDDKLTQQRVMHLFASPKPDDPSPYAWLEANREFHRSDLDGVVRLPSIGAGGGAVLAFTAESDGSMPIPPAHQGSLELCLETRSVARVTVRGLGGERPAQVLVGFRGRGETRHAAWTKGGIAEIPLVAALSRVTIDPLSAVGELAIISLVAPEPCVAVDLAVDPMPSCTLTLPPTGALSLECRDPAGEPVMVTGSISVSVHSTSRVPAGRAGRILVEERIVDGRGSIALVGLGLRLGLVVKIDGRESAIQCAVEGPTESAETVTVPIVIDEDQDALRRAAEEKRRAAIVAELHSQEAAAERAVIRDAIERHDSWAVGVIAAELTRLRAFDRAVAVLRDFCVRETVEYRTKYKDQYRGGQQRIGYVHLASAAPEAMIDEYWRQLGNSDLESHRVQ